VSRRRSAVTSVAALVGAGALVAALTAGHTSGHTPGHTAQPPPDVAPSAPSPVASTPNEPTTTTARVRSFDRARHSTADPHSPWVVVNKKHRIRPLDFRPDVGLVRGYQVAEQAVTPLTRLLAEADRRGLGLKIASAFRSSAYQDGVYSGIVRTRGQRAADRVSARPGHSEHQTGLAVDLVVPVLPATNFTPAFADTRAGRWLAREAWRYGFIIRYQRGSEQLTGYRAEPWHLRYVGRPLAAELRRLRYPTLEEYFSITGGDYRVGMP